MTFVTFDHLPKGIVAFEGRWVLLNESYTVESQGWYIEF